MEKLVNLEDLLKHNLASEIAIMDKLIDNILTGKHLIKMISEHLIYSGGKKLRPSLTIIIAKMFNYDQKNQDYIKLATAIEFIHTATLLHDDVIDESDYRRGKETANNIWGNQLSILVGDYLLSQAFSLMTEIGNIKILSKISDLAKFMAEGEITQLSRSADLSLTEQEYFNIIGGKTAELFAASAATGAIIANQNEATINSINNFAYNMGLSFQIIDDILDYIGSVEKMGKKPGSDFRDGKITLPLILAYNDSSEEDRSEIEQFFDKLQRDEEDFEIMKKIMEKNCSIDKSYQIANLYISQARFELSTYKDSVEKDILSLLLDFSTKRLY